LYCFILQNQGNEVDKKHSAYSFAFSSHCSEKSFDMITYTIPEGQVDSN